MEPKRQKIAAPVDLELLVNHCLTRVNVGVNGHTSGRYNRLNGYAAIDQQHGAGQEQFEFHRHLLITSSGHDLYRSRHSEIQ